MPSGALPFRAGKLFLSTAPSSIFNVQSFFYYIDASRCHFFGVLTQFISLY